MLVAELHSGKMWVWFILPPCTGGAQHRIRWGWSLALTLLDQHLPGGRVLILHVTQVSLGQAKPLSQPAVCKFATCCTLFQAPLMPLCHVVWEVKDISFLFPICIILTREIEYHFIGSLIINIYFFCEMPIHYISQYFQLMLIFLYWFIKRFCRLETSFLSMFTSYVVNISSYLFLSFSFLYFICLCIYAKNNISIFYIKSYLSFLALMPLLSSNI